MPIFEGLGRALRWLRERQLKRQYQVAEGAGITKAMLSAYETGKQKPSLDTLEKILDALFCDLNDLHNALQIINGRPERMRNAGADRDHLHPGGERPAAGQPLDPSLYQILGTEEPLPAQEEQAMSEMLGGFHKLLRYLHGRLPRAAGAAAPPAPASGIAGGARPSGPAPPGAAGAPSQARPERPERPTRGGS
jgi:transcriptional regulator with XRE-family HTH domain